MQRPIKERISKLREEIARIREANRLYVQGERKTPSAASDHERRLQRLQEILDELMSLTEWKRVWVLYIESTSPIYCSAEPRQFSLRKDEIEIKYKLWVNSCARRNYS